MPTSIIKVYDTRRSEWSEGIFVLLLWQQTLASAQSFIYDNANRLTQITYSNGLTISYSYDKLGNRISQTINASPLPIVLNHFSANAEKCEVNIRWQSGEQSSIQTFALERSEDGSSFTQIASIAVKPEGSYEYKDIATGKHYYHYRLKIINKDNSYRYSRLLSVFTDCANPYQFSVFPNPADETVNVKFTAKENGAYQLALYDVQGRKVSYKDLSVQQKMRYNIKK